jgi:hypothetical protein
LWADPDSFGKSRQQWVFEQLFDQTGRITGQTLEEYIEQRMNGGAPAVPSGSVQQPGNVASSAGAGSQSEHSVSASETLASSVAPVSSSSDSADDGQSLSQIEAGLDSAMKQYQKMAADGQGNSSEARQLLAEISKLKSRRDKMIEEKTAAARTAGQ